MERHDYVVIKATVSKYDKIFDFQEDMGKVLYKGKFGFINKKGQEVIPCIYDATNNFNEGLAVVKKNCKSFIINKQNIKISLEYDFISDFKNGYAIISKDSKYGLINTKGEEVIPAIYDEIDYPSEGLIHIKEKGIHKYVNLNNQVVIELPKQVRRAYPFSDGIARIESENYKTSFIDKKGVQVTEAIYDSASDFYGNLASVHVKNEGTTIICLDGQELLPRTNNFTIDACVSKDGIFIAQFGFLKKGLIDRFGNFITDKFYSYISHESEGLIRVKDQKNNFGFIDLEGHEVIPPIFQTAGDFKDGLAKVLDIKTHKYGFINKQGELAIPYMYDMVSDFHDGKSIVLLDGNSFYIDKNNNSLHLEETKQKIIEIALQNSIPAYVQDYNYEKDFLAFETKLYPSYQWQPQTVLTYDINDYDGHIKKVIAKEIEINNAMQDLVEESSKKLIK